jgi:quercetin dioxygenase-like cupin family protein
MKKAFIGKAMDVEPIIYDDGGKTVKGAHKRVLIGNKLGAPNFVMRLFTLEKDGFSPRHTHDWEHEVFVLKGKLEVFNGEEYVIAEEGDFVFVPPNVEHQFKNINDGESQFICVIPKSGGE